LAEFLPIGRLFSLASLLKITVLAETLGLLFSTVPVEYYFLQKMGLATFWAACSQTHLVTLRKSNEKIKGERSRQTLSIFLLPSPSGPTHQWVLQADVAFYFMPGAKQQT
jgi:hypothetical protein